MRVVDAVSPKSQPFDIPSGLARILITKGFVVEWLPPAPQIPDHDLQFSIQRFKDGRPYIFGDCPNCHPRFNYVGEHPETQVLRHAGKPVVIPPDICERYLKLLKAYMPQRAERPERQREVVSSF